MMYNVTAKCIKSTCSIRDNGLLRQSGFIRLKTTSADYQFLQRSVLPTLYFQKSLPRLPIPQLEKTCQRYLAALEPILDRDEFARAQTSVSEFENGIGKRLQLLLNNFDNANKHTSYISQPWFDMYLRDRAPLPLNYNPLMVMRPSSNAEYNTQLLVASNLVISALRFKRSLDGNVLEPEVFHLNPKKSDNDKFRWATRLAPTIIATYVAYAFKAFPLDMSQYQRLFGVTRIPQIGKDRIYQVTDSKHILVMRGGKFFVVNVLDANGDIEPANVIMGRLKVVIDQNPTGEVVEEIPLGVMTTTDRDSWARTRQYLVDIGNEKLMDLIDSALFCVCLDGQDVTMDENNPTVLMKHFLSGDGINRWFDKSLSILVASDGTAAVNFEHSWGDGVAVLRFFNEISKEINEKPLVHPDTVPLNMNHGDNTVRSIDFQHDERIAADVAKAQKKHLETMESLNMGTLRYYDINKKICKQNQVSPDSMMQLAFQLAYRKSLGGYVGTYESCSTAAFLHGRTETMRPCTMATKTFIESLLKSNPRSANSLEHLAMLKTCSSVHGQLTRDAAMGQGFDRHLFGLKHIAEMNQVEVPSLYNEEPYRKINHHIISTSTLSSPYVLSGAFGPVVKDGLGIGYVIHDNECGVVVTSYKGQCDGTVFVHNLKEAFDTIRDILTNRPAAA